MSNPGPPEIVEIIEDDLEFVDENCDNEITIEYIPMTHHESIPYFAGQDLIQWYPNVEEAKHAVELYQISTNTKYIKLNNHKYGEDITRSRIRWDDSTNIPHVILRSLNLECQHAKDRNKESNRMRREQGTGPYQINGEQRERKKYTCSKGSKKGNCKATVSMIEVLRFPQYQISDTSKPNKSATSKLIRRGLQRQDSSMEKDFAVRVVFPALESHSGHSFGDITETQKHIIKITELASEIIKVSTLVSSTDLLQEAHSNLTSVLQRLEEEFHKTKSKENVVKKKSSAVGKLLDEPGRKKLKIGRENILQHQETFYVSLDNQESVIVTRKTEANKLLESDI